METGNLKIFGKNIVSIFHHHIMYLKYEDIDDSTGTLTMECVTSNPERMIGGTYSLELSQKILKDNRNRSDAFVFTDSHGNTVGTLSVMFKGGNDLEYRIRGIDAFIFNVLTVERFRGKGYAGEMIRLLMEHLHSQNINKAYLAVSTNNDAAVRAYQKAGFMIEYDTAFLRIMRLNIPYKTL